MRKLWFVLRSRLRARQDFADEIESHIALEAERLIAEGVSANDAMYEARRRFGNVANARERFHEARVLPVIDTVLQDIRYCMRALMRAPAFTAVAVLSLALGIGANTAIFTFVNAALFKPLPVPNPDRIVMVSPDPGLFETIDYSTVVRFREYPQLFDGVAAVFPIDRANVTIDAQPVGRALVHLVTGDYFATLGVRAAVGRTITMDDERTLGGHAVVVISDAYWRSAFAGSHDVLGRTLMLNGTSYVVIGVAPPRFTGDDVGVPADLWIPVMMQSEVMPEQPNILFTPRRYFRMLARLEPGMTIEQATHLAADVYRQIASAPRPDQQALTPAELAAIEVKITSERHGRTPAVEDKAEPMVVMWAIVALVLAIALVNVSGLLLVRASTRERELSTRLALGASMGRVARLVLTEGALIGTAASVLGVGVAVLGARWLQRVAATGTQPIRLDLAADARVLALTIATSLVAIFVCGLVPARRASRLSVAAGLKGSRDLQVRGARSTFGRLLVVAQVSLAVTLVVAAGLFTRTLSALENQNTGFDRQRLLEAATLPEQANIGGDRLVNLYDAVIERLGALPGVEAVAVSSRGLLSGTGSGAVNTTVAGYVRPANEQPFIPYNYVTPAFFRVAGMTLVAGRTLEPGDIAGRQRVAVISESMARHYYGTVNAVGRRFGIARDVGTPIEVVGVVRDTKDRSLRDENIAMMYLPYRQDRRVRGMSVIVRANAGADPAGLAPAVRRALRDLEPALPVLSVETMQNQMRDTITMEWLTALASSFFGGIALLLAALGMFAITAQSVVRRTSEIGIRIALGGTRGSVVRLVVAESLLVVAVGLVAGNALAVLAKRAVASRLFGVPSIDLRTFIAATAIMTGAAVAAALLPARRATQIDPAISLRHE